jgi:hypothetical protein
MKNKLKRILIIFGIIILFIAAFIFGWYLFYLQINLVQYLF